MFENKTFSQYQSAGRKFEIDKALLDIISLLSGNQLTAIDKTIQKLKSYQQRFYWQVLLRHC